MSTQTTEIAVGTFGQATHSLVILDQHELTKDQLVILHSGYLAVLAQGAKAGTLPVLGAFREMLKVGYTIARGDGRSAMALMAAGNYGKVWPNARAFVESADFPMSSVRENADFELVGFDHNPKTQEVLDEFVRRGLERPLPEDSLRFGEKYPDDVQKERPLAFLHKPWRTPDGDLEVLCLSEWSGGRDLYTGLFENKWNRDCRFPARRPRNFLHFSPR